MRLLNRTDTPLLIALVASIVVVFRAPLGSLLLMARDAEFRYHLDLLPGLAVLVTTFGYHTYRKRFRRSPDEGDRAALPAHADDLQQLVAFGRAVEAAQARARAEELQRLVVFGRALGQAVEHPALKQVLWRYLPVFARDRAFWVLTRRDQHWDAHLQDFRIDTWSNDELERLAADALVASPAAEADGPGVLVGENLCFPLVVGNTPVGVLGVQNSPPIDLDERRALGAAVALIAIAIRNVQLLVEARDHSVRDRLTGCFSHAHGVDTLRAELLRARRSRHPISVILFDVDHFKLINDRYGHVVGDTMLQAVGKALGRVLRVSDLKCRYGGDEFFVVLPETPVSGAVQAAESLVREIAQLRVPCGSGVASTTVSVGIAAAMPGEVNPDAVIARADDAMYQAKRTGRNRYVVAADVMLTDAGVGDDVAVMRSEPERPGTPAPVAH